MCLIVKVSHLFLAEPGVCVARRAAAAGPPVGGPAGLRLDFFFFCHSLGFFFSLVCKTKPCFPSWLLLCVQRRVFTPCLWTPLSLPPAPAAASEGNDKVLYLS